VSTFFGPSGPPSDPPKSDIFRPPSEQKYRRFCWVWEIYRANLWGRFWGSKSEEFLQKSAKFQKIPFLGVRVPEVEIYRFLTILDPPMANQILATFGSIYNHPILIIFKSLFNQFINAPFWSYFSINFHHL
jgi:hypothetical protein